MASFFKNISTILTAVALVVLMVSGVSIPFTQAGHVRMIVLLSHVEGPYKETLDGFQEYLNGQGVQADLEIFNLDGDASRAMETLNTIQSSEGSLIFTLGSLAMETAIREGSDIPIIAGMVMNPNRLIETENATGVFMEFPIETQFQWLKTFIPHAATIGVIYNPSENQGKIDAAKQVAKKMGLRLEAQEVQSPREMPAALKNLSSRADVLWGISDQLVLNPQTARHILLFSFRNQIPFIGLSANWVKAGALYSLEWDYTDLGMQCGSMAYAVLQGTDVRSLPPVSPRTVKYCVNQKTAQNIKIDIPKRLLTDADKVY